MILRFAFRELLRHWKYSLFLILNLSLGLTGFLTVEFFKGMISDYVTRNSKSILSADLSISARRKITEDELKKVRGVLGPVEKESHLYDFFAMASLGTSSKLVLIKAIDSNYPLYGEIVLESGRRIRGADAKVLFSSQKVWAYPEVKHLLNLKKGSKFKLGQLEVEIDDFIARDSTQTFRLAALAPRIYIDQSLLDRSGLIQFGSTFTEAYLYKLPEQSLKKSLQSEIYSLIKDPAFQVDTPATASENSARQLNYLSDFLGLAAIVALILSCLGTSYLYQLYLSQRLKEIAILRTLGLQASEAVSIYVIQIVLIGIVSLVPTFLGVSALLPLLIKLIGQFVPYELEMSFQYSSIVVTTLISICISVLVTLPYIYNLRSLKPFRLLIEDKFSGTIRGRNWILFTPSLLLIWALSMWESNSFKTGTLFLAALLLVLIFISVLFVSFVRVLRFIPPNLNWSLKFALKSIQRKTSQTLAVFTALTLGSLLINLLPQIKSGIKSEISIDGNANLPSAFLFDIQDDQINELKNFFNDSGTPLIDISPLVRGRILKINAQNFERQDESQSFKSREDEQEARFRNRGVNLSYRDALTSTEEIVKGRRFGKFEDGKAEISVEEKYAERVGIQLNDTVTFDIQGTEIVAQVVSFRRVKWNSFRPNFFIMFQDGVLNEAPKSFIAVLPQMDEEKKTQLLSQMNTNFPNVSAVDLNRTITEVLNVGEQMSWSLELMALLALITGYVVLFSIVRVQIRSRRWELNLLKILGSSFKSIQSTLSMEFTFLGFISAVLGSLVSFLIAGLLMKQIFNSYYEITDWKTPLFSCLIIPLICYVICWISTRQVAFEEPSVLLREG